MRSSKSRSRSKANRPRSLGNIINRVFDSSGPEGKVRGTPQQIIEKYLILARDAQLSNDRVAAENFQQHAEHYTRLLGEAQRELAAEQEERQRQNQHNQNHNGGNGGNGNGARDRDGQPQGHAGGQSPRPEWRDRSEQPRYDSGRHDSRADGDNGVHSTDVIDFAEEDAVLVDTPEARDDAYSPRGAAPVYDAGQADLGLPRDLPPEGAEQRPAREKPAPRPSFTSQRAKPKSDGAKSDAPKSAAPKSSAPRAPRAKIERAKDSAASDSATSADAPLVDLPPPATGDAGA